MNEKVIEADEVIIVKADKLRAKCLKLTDIIPKLTSHSKPWEPFSCFQAYYASSQQISLLVVYIA